MEAWGPLILTYNIYYTVRIRVFVRNLSVKSNLNIKRNYFKIFFISAAIFYKWNKYLFKSELFTYVN